VGGMLVLSAGLTLLISAVWWLPAVRAHGFGPWFGAAGSSDWIPAYVLFFRLLSGLDPVTIVLSLIGALWGDRRTLGLLSVYGFSMFVVLPRSAPQFAIVLIAMLFGIGAQPVINRLLKPLDTSTSPSAARLSKFPVSARALALLLAFLFVPNWVATVTSPILLALTPAERLAMSWAREHTSPDSRFLVIEGVEFYAAKNAEWFPALSGRVNAVTVQGNEWLEDVDIADQIALLRELERCGYAGVDCISAWAAASGIEFTHLYVVSREPTKPDLEPCCEILLDSLGASDAYRLVYANADVSVFERRK